MSHPIYAAGAPLPSPPYSPGSVATHTAGGLTQPAAPPPPPAYQTIPATWMGMVFSYPGDCPSMTSAWLAGTGRGAALTGKTPFGDTFPNCMANKLFYYPTEVMTTWAQGHKKTDQESQIPGSALLCVCIPGPNPKITPAMITNYVNSIPPRQAPVVMIPSQEYEHQGWGSPSAYFAWFEQMSAAIRAARPPGVQVLIMADSAGSAYNKGGNGYTGSWIVPATGPGAIDFDIYGSDQYQNRAVLQPGGLASSPQFQTWLGYVGHSGKKLMTPEYGVCAAPGAAAQRDRIAADMTYLLSPQVPLWFGVIYWYSDCTAGGLAQDDLHRHQFTDPATIKMWNDVLSGTF